MSRGGQAGKLGETVPRETLNGVKEGSLYDMKAKSREVAGVTPLPPIYTPHSKQSASSKEIC